MDISPLGNKQSHVYNINHIGSIYNDTTTNMCLYVDGDLVTIYGPRQGDPSYDSGGYYVKRQYIYGSS